MSGRVLNFLEFSDKYSNVSNEPARIDEITNASSNFEEGIEEETYDQPEIKPNRPVAGNYEMTPALPGETGAPAFSAENSEEMNAPTEVEGEMQKMPQESEEETNEEPEESEDADDDEESEDDQLEEGNPEAGANPKKKVEESLFKVKGFSQFINENYESHGDYPNLFDEEEYADNYGDDDTCPKCGESPIANEYGSSCGCNM